MPVLRNLTVLASAAVLSGCSAVSGQLGGSDAAANDDEVRSASALITQEWGVTGSLLSVLVQNPTDRTLHYAEGLVVARTADGETVVSSVDADPLCCNVHELGPGEEFGFYVDLGSAEAATVEEVDVSYRNLSWTAAGETDEVLDVQARSVGLERGSDGAVVLADLISDIATPEVLAQAVVRDPAGRLVAVVSGRWSCVVPGTRSIRMELFHVVPADARVDQVLVHPVEDDPTRPAPDCADAGLA